MKKKITKAELDRKLYINQLDSDMGFITPQQFEKNKKELLAKYEVFAGGKRPRNLALLAGLLVIFIAAIPAPFAKVDAHSGYCNYIGAWSSGPGGSGQSPCTPIFTCFNPTT